MEHMQVPIPAGAGPAVLVAIELSKMTWLLAVYDPFTSKVSHRRVDGGDADGLIALLGRSRRDIEERAGTSVGIECVFEAGYDGILASATACSSRDRLPRNGSCKFKSRSQSTPSLNGPCKLREPVACASGMAAW